MEQHISKALIQYVSPNFEYSCAPRNYPSLTFFSLSKEIRDQIYDYALVSTSSIIVWKGKMEDEFLAMYEGPRRIWWGHPLSRLMWRVASHKETAVSLCNLSLNLLFSSKAVSQEAAMVFYNKNTFAFEGDHNWDPVVRWLKTIGTNNRNSLAILEAHAGRPDQVWQNSRGERLRHPGGCTTEEIYPRHPYLGTPTNGFEPGSVDNINPALEDIFAMLGQRTSKKKTTITMRIGGCYPGGGARPRTSEDQCPEDGWYGMELPNLLERFLELHSNRSEKGSVEVVWKGLTFKRELMAEQDLIKNLGWNLSISPAGNYEVRSKYGSIVNSENFVEYRLRREKTTGPLITQSPSLYSDMYMYSMTDRDREIYL